MIPQLLQFVEKHWLLWVAFFIIIALIIFEELKKVIRPSTSLLPQEVVNLMNHEEASVVDIRDNAAFKAGHIINAINVPKSDWQKHEQKLAQFKDKKLVIVAATEEDAGKIAGQLKSQGFGKVYILAAGIGAWKRANLPLVQK